MIFLFSGCTDNVHFHIQLNCFFFVTKILFFVVLLTGRKHRKRQQNARRTWTNDEKIIVMKCLGNYIRKQCPLPGKQQCEDLIKSNPVMNGRRWQNVKDFIRNERKKHFSITFD